MSNMIGDITKHVLKVPTFLHVEKERCQCGGLIVGGKCGQCEIRRRVTEGEKRRVEVWDRIEARKRGE